MHGRREGKRQRSGEYLTLQSCMEVRIGLAITTLDIVSAAENWLFGALLCFGTVFQSTTIPKVL